MKKILVVDDEILVRKAMSRLFLNDGHLVQEAENGEQALQLFLEFKPDLIFLDIMMPIMDGPSFMKAFLKLNGDPKSVFYMSAISLSEELPFQTQVRGFIQKPFENLFALKDLIHEPNA